MCLQTGLNTEDLDLAPKPTGLDIKIPNFTYRVAHIIL